MTARLSVRTATVALSAAGLALAGTVVAGSPASAAAGGERLHFVAPLSGSQETAAGDEDGKGKGVLDLDLATGEICYALTVRGTSTPVAAHLHSGARGANGPVVQGFAAPADGSSAGCVVNPTVARAVAADPAAFYLNVHTQDFPGGAVRGQLSGRP